LSTLTSRRLSCPFAPPRTVVRNKLASFHPGTRRLFSKSPGPSLSLRLPALQHFQIYAPDPPQVLPNQRLKMVAPSSIVPPSGFGYPLGDVSCADPRKPLPAPHAPGLFLFRALLRQVIRANSRSLVPLLRFATKPFRALYRRSSGFLPPRQPARLLLGRVIPPTSATLALLRFRAFQAPPLEPPDAELLLQRLALPRFPFLSPMKSSKRKIGALGLLSAQARSPLLRRVRACLTFPTVHPSPESLKHQLVAAYFFSSGSKASHEAFDGLLCNLLCPA
jgi:hypothetical protein